MIRMIYVSSFSDFVGGGEYSLFDLITHLPTDVEPMLVVPSAGALSDAADRAGIGWHSVPMPPIGVRAIPSLGRWLRMLRACRPDMVHANNSRAAFYAGLAGRILGIPVLFHCRINQPDIRLDRWLVRLVHGVVVNSRATAKRFSVWPWLKCWTVYNGVDSQIWQETGRHAARPRGAEQVLLMVARVSRWKRHDIALRVFARLAGRFKGLHLVFLGGKDPMDHFWWHEMQQRTRDTGYARRIHWVGGVERVKLGGWYEMADVLILPSDEEPFGRVLVEAMAMGLPVVAFDGGGVSEVVQHERQGLLVPAGNVSAFSRAVERLLSDDVFRLYLGEEGKRRAREFSIERHVETVCRIYQEVLDA